MEPGQASFQEMTGRNVVLSPDPTLLTAQAVTAAKEEIRRELVCVQEVMKATLAGIQAVLETRIVTLERVDTLMQAQLDAVPTERAIAIQHVRELMVEQFSTIEAHRRRIEMELTNAVGQHQRIRDEAKQMIDTAILTQRDAINVQTQHMTQTVNRIEMMATRQLEQITTLLQTAVAGLQSKIDDSKERLTLLEGRTAGITVATTQQREETKMHREGGQFVVAIIGFVAGTMLGIVGILVAIFKG